MRSTTFVICSTLPIIWQRGSISLAAVSGPKPNSRTWSAAIARRAAEDRWRRLPGLTHVGRRCLEMARRLADWREDEARRVNRPMRQVLRDDLLVAIAKRQPTNRRGLEALPRFQSAGGY